MPYFNTIKLLAACALLASTTLSFSHEKSGHPSSAKVKKEQKDWGISGDAKAARRSITITMTDTMRFSPDKLQIRQGETIKFTIKNKGKMLHEFVIGTKKELNEHAALMLKFPNMEHDEPYMAHVPPGKTGTIVWTFNKAGNFDFACLIAGHYQAGMVGTIAVLGKN
jgi:uncharacterized cupredoxin-like copper-binding protein